MTFSSDTLPQSFTEAERFSLFRDLYVANYVSVDLFRDPSMPFRMQMEFSQVRSVSIGRFEGTITTFRRGQSQVNAAGNDDFCFTINTGRTLIATEFGPKQTILTPGSGMLIGYAEAGSFDVKAPGSWLSLTVPRKIMNTLVRSGDDLLGKQVPAESEVIKHLVRYTGILRGRTEIAPSALADHIETTLLDLIVLALDQKDELTSIASGRGLQAARAQAILDDLHRHFANSALTPNVLARRHGVSERYVHTLLEHTGKTFSEHLLDVRLERARSMLRNPQFANMSIAQIGDHCGFSDTSHFIRRFRQRFNATPGGYRSDPPGRS